MMEQQTKENTEARQSPLLVHTQSNHDTGLHSGAAFNIPYLADFEDGWVSLSPLLSVELKLDNILCKRWVSHYFHSSLIKCFGEMVVIFVQQTL
jgi:hypothetical protein